RCSTSRSGSGRGRSPGGRTPGRQPPPGPCRTAGAWDEMPVARPRKVFGPSEGGSPVSLQSPNDPGAAVRPPALHMMDRPGGRRKALDPHKNHQGSMGGRPAILDSRIATCTRRSVRTRGPAAMADPDSGLADDARGAGDSATKPDRANATIGSPDETTEFVL